MRIKLDIPLSIFEITRICNGKANCSEAMITHITTDSRELEYDDLFICIKGEKFDGEAFAEDVISRGGVALSTKEGKGRITVNSTLDALLLLAKNYLSKFHQVKHKIVVTGSVGKTTTKEMIGDILSHKYKVHKTEGNKNNHIGVPLTILSAPKDTEILVIEMGMNHLGEIRKLAECLEPDIGIITNIGSSHIGNLGSREKIAEAKLEILYGMKNGILLVPADESLLENINGKTTFSINDPTADFYIKNIDHNKISIYRNGDLFCSVSFFHRVDYLQKNLISACASATLCGMSSDELKIAVSNFSKDIIRQKIQKCKSLHFYMDCYNASPESLLASFEAVKSLTEYHRKSLVLGDIGELGDYSKDIHTQIGRSISGELFSHLYLFGRHAEFVKKGAIESGFKECDISINLDPESPDLTADQIKSFSKPGELIVLKGSRFMMLERIPYYFDKGESHKNEYSES